MTRLFYCRLALCLGLLGILGACAGFVPPDAPSAAIINEELPQQTLEPLPRTHSQEDPFERFNRSVYYFNADFDRKIFLPALRAYRFVTPHFVRRGVINFFSNLSDLRNGFNGLLQARPEVTGRAVIRLFVNTTVGLLGTIDVATDLGVHQHVEDFGQTLGRWGAGPGPYLVLPIFGPSNIRDATGLGVDYATGFYVPPLSTVNDVVYRYPIVYVPQALSERDKFNFRYYDSGSPFEYDLVRFLYLRKREIDVAE
ncbi:MAG: VacJ family lipoprotein [Pseudomonadota bacterium]